MQRALKLHLDFTIHSQLVSGNYFLLVLYKTFCKWKGSVFLEVATKIMFKDKFLAMSVPVEVLFFQILCVLSAGDWLVCDTLTLTLNINSRCPESRLPAAGSSVCLLCSV